MNIQMKIVRLWEFDIRSGASLAGFGQFMGAGGCIVQYRMLGFHLKGATNNVCMMSGVAFALASRIIYQMVNKFDESFDFTFCFSWWVNSQKTHHRRAIIEEQCFRLNKL